MHPFVPNNPNPLHVASQAERLARQEHGTWGLVFQSITAVSLAVVTSKMLLDMLRDHEKTRNKAQGADENLGPLVRREVERTLAAHDTHRGRGA
jgi:hypothetical protein